jgi:uncharacterized protein YutE (UPF0331/DUF86 family)
MKFNGVALKKFAVMDDEIATMIQFRNFVVHRYERVDSAVLVDIVLNRLGDLTSFRNEIAGAV